MTEIHVSKSALIHNLRAYGRAVNADVMAIVKSNAYGHGLNLVASAIEKEVAYFGVASLDEAIELRLHGKIRKPILVLSFYDLAKVAEALKHKISLAVYDLKQAQSISAAAKKLKVTAKIHLKIDTGTSRLGIFPKDAAQFIDKLIHLSNIQIEGVFSHFAASEDDEQFTRAQNHQFDAVLEELEWRGVNPIKHIACTAAGAVVPASRHDLVRLGIGLYGLWPSEKIRKLAKFDLKPVLSWHTQVVQVKTLPKGTNVGYSFGFKTTHETKLAVLPIGYYDGYDRKLSNVGEVLIGGKRCRVLGRVCMNLTMVDVTAVKDVKAGTPVVLIGRQGKEEITADEIAKKIGTINYEVVTRLNPNILRILKNV